MNAPLRAAVSPSAETRPGRHVIVVGGGVAGALFAVELMQQASEPVAITILEPRERLGVGVACSTTEPHHVTNVPASRMSADPDDQKSFTRWLERNGDRTLGDERDAYPRRELYGRMGPRLSVMARNGSQIDQASRLPCSKAAAPSGA